MRVKHVTRYYLLYLAAENLYNNEESMKCL